MKKTLMFLLVSMINFSSLLIGMGMPQMGAGNMQQMQDMEKQLMQENLTLKQKKEKLL